MSMDLTESIQPRSDQVNADDLIACPITYTVREVVQGVAEPPFDFLLVETERAYRPSKTMRRVIVNAWGPDAANYAGRRLTLYREPSIMFGGQKIGGIRISHMSHIDGPIELLTQTSRGKREKFTVKPLDDAPDAPIPLRMQLTHMSAQEKADLWKFAVITPGTKMPDVRSRLIAYADELGLEFTEEPNARLILDAARAAQKTNQPNDAAAEFHRFAVTGEDTDPGGQTTIAGEVPA